MTLGAVQGAPPIRAVEEEREKLDIELDDLEYRKGVLEEWWRADRDRMWEVSQGGRAVRG